MKFTFLPSLKFLLYTSFDIFTLEAILRHVTNVLHKKLLAPFRSSYIIYIIVRGEFLTTNMSYVHKCSLNNTNILALARFRMF